MHYHIILSEKCNSECRYCYKKSMEDTGEKINEAFKFDFSEPADSIVDINKLKKFLSKDNDPVLIFYGGEPLVNIKKLIEIMDNIDVKYRMQTNGLLLNKLETKYLQKIEKILVSIDGNKDITDYFRGKGTYDKIVSNLNLIRNNGYSGELVARITLSEENYDIESIIKDLNSLKLFDSFHWQIDAGFYESDFDEKKFKIFVREYNKSVSKLLSNFMESLKTGNVLKLYPFIGIIDSLLNNEKTLLRCGAGHSGFAITTSGKIVACPIMNSIKNFSSGDLSTNPSNLKKHSIKGMCLKCNYKDICGGRCLYYNQAGLWNKTGNKMICSTVIYLIEEIKLIIPEIKSLIKIGTLPKDAFKYEKYFGPEIIP